MSQRGNRALLGAYITCCALAAASATAVALWFGGDLDLATIAGFGVLALLAETFAVTTASGSTYSVTFVVTLAAAVTVGPAGAILASLCGTTGLRDARQRPPVKHLFNASQLALATGGAAVAYRLVAGPGAGFGRALLAAACAALVNFATNTSLVATAIGLSSRQPIRVVWRSQYLHLGPAYLAYAALGLLLAELHASVGWASVLFFLVPLLVARHAFRAAIDLQDAFDRVVTTLVAAVEQKDAYTGGHAERVARLAEHVARAYGMTVQEARAIRYAALMHDIGKLAVHNAVLQKDGKLTDAEHEHMRRHPEHGVELARGIDLLQPVLDGIRHHHERWDGTGYPDQLAGEAIPVAARIITVSDAFDAMTTTRAYRPGRSAEAAFTELDRCAGTQFDPKAVRALRRAVAAGGWTPPSEAETDSHDHGHDHGHEHEHLPPAPALDHDPRSAHAEA